MMRRKKCEMTQLEGERERARGDDGGGFSAKKSIPQDGSLHRVSHFFVLPSRRREGFWWFILPPAADAETLKIANE